jgi:apolipoprotein N-acyltransferase
MPPVESRDLFARAPLSWSVIAGAALALAYPPFNLGSLAFVLPAIALWIVGLAGESMPPWRAVAWRAWVFGAVFHFCTLYWAGWVTVAGMLVMVAVLGGYVMLVVLATRAAIVRLGPAGIWTFPVLWTAHEYLRTLGQLAFPWTNLSLSQVWALPLLQIAEFTGDLGVGLLVALINVCIFESWRQYSDRGWRVALRFTVIALLLLAAPILWGARRMGQIAAADTVRVAVLQGDIDSYAKWENDFVDRSMAIYEAQSRAAAAAGAELIVWPETAAPMYLRADQRYLKEMRDLSRELRAPLLVGTLEFKRLDNGGYLRYNAAVQLVRGVYQPDFHAKLHLVPFGEWIPFSNYVQVLDKLEVGGAHFTAGEKYVLFEHPKGPYAAAICYESVFPGIIRQFARRGARFFVTITNDGWYGFSSGPPQHAAHAVLRAIETRCPFARAANTGISCFVDRIGIMHQPTHQYVPDLRIQDLPLGKPGEMTFFVRHGLWLGQACAGFSLALILWLAVPTWRRRPPAKSPLLALLILLPFATAQATPRSWTNFTDVNDVNAIASRGDTVWVATDGGLVRLLDSDPDNQTRFTNADGLGGNRLRFVTVDSNGVVWCGGENGRLSRRLQDQNWRTYLFEDDAGLPIPLNAATPGPDGFLWVASDRGVHKFDTQRNGGEIKESYTRIGDWPDESAVADLVVVGGILYAVGVSGVAAADVNDQFLLDRGHWATQLTAEPLRFLAYIGDVESRIVAGAAAGYSLVSYDSGEHSLSLGVFVNSPNLADAYGRDYHIWFLSADGRYIARSFPSLRVPPQGTVPAPVAAGFTSIHLTDNAVYFGQTNGGLWRLGDAGWTHIEPDGPLDNDLADLAVDPDGRLWTAHTNRGAAFLNESGWHTIPYISAGASGPMTSVDVAPDGGVWYGIFGGGVWFVNPDDPQNPGAAINYKKPNSSLMWVQNPTRPGDFEYVVVQDVVVDYQGRVWCANGFADSGAVVAWNDHGCWGRFDQADGIPSNRPGVVYPLDSSVLVGFANIGIVEINFREPLCDNGLPVTQIPRVARRTSADGLPSDDIRAILYDQSDSLWVGTNLGLARYARDRRRFFEVEMPSEAGLTVNTLAVDDANGIWIGTTLGLVVREADGAMTFYNSRNSGLVGDHVTHIDIDRRTGDIWIATRSGVSRTQGPLPETGDIEQTVAYPNPFEIGVHNRVRFNAPSGSRVTITTAAGFTVAQIDSDSGWDGRNRAGELVATGVYLFVVRSPEGDYGAGKIAVIHR